MLYIIDFNNMPLEDASDYKLPFAHVKTYVKPERDKNRRKTTRLNWWKFGEKRPAMRKAIKDLPFYFAIPAHSKWFVFLPINYNYVANNSIILVASDDFYVLGILTSKIHRIWVKAQSSTLEDRTRYTNTTCFETFPFPQLENAPFSLKDKNNKKEPKIVEQIRNKMLELHEYRTEQMDKKQWGITKLYNAFFEESSSKLSQLHQQLDELVTKAYNFDKKEDLLAQILALNLQIAEQEKNS